MWEFSVGLYMIRIWPGSLLFTAIYGVVESSSVAVFGPIVGTLVDKLTYLQVSHASFAMFIKLLFLAFKIIYVRGLFVFLGQLQR